MTQDLCPLMMPFDHVLVRQHCFEGMTARPLLLWCWLMIEMPNLPHLKLPTCCYLSAKKAPLLAPMLEIRHTSIR
jgi:hypothetical protein